MAKEFESNRFTWEDGDLEIFDSIEEMNEYNERRAKREAEYGPGERFIFDPDDFVFYETTEELEAASEREDMRRAKEREAGFTWDMEVIEVFDSIEELNAALAREAHKTQ